MLVKYSDAVVMFKELGFHTANKWNTDKLVKKLNDLPNIIEDTQDLPQAIVDDAEECKLLINQLCKAADGGEKIELEQGEKSMKSKEKNVEQAEKKADKEKPAKKNKEKKEKKEKNVVVKKEPAAKDRFGNRLGSKLAEVNAMLGKKPVTMKEIEDHVGDTYYNHINDLIEAGFVKKTADGFVAVGK